MARSLPTALMLWATVLLGCQGPPSTEPTATNRTDLTAQGRGAQEQGELAKAAVPQVERPSSTPARDQRGDERTEHPGNAELSGAVSWDDGGSVKPLPRQQLFLKGIAGAAGEREAYYVTRSDQEGRYRFTDVIPGAYLLTNRVAGAPTWRLKVTLDPGQSLALDLTRRNSVKIRDDFPQHR